MIGSGYRLEFTFNPFAEATSVNYDTEQDSATFTAFSNVAAELKSGNDNGQVFFPDLDVQKAAPKSFMIRPYQIVVVQQVGGDGVDLGTGVSIRALRCLWQYLHAHQDAQRKREEGTRDWEGGRQK